jgi:hypothetical protein
MMHTASAPAGTSGAGGVKTYRGIREPFCHVRVLEDAGAALPSTVPSPLAPMPPPLPGTNGAHGSREHELVVPRELVAQAPAPFEWGLDGHGTHYLAVALLADLLGAAERTAIKSALPFMRRFLSRLPEDDFEISETVFRAFLYAVAVAGAGAAVRPRALPGKPGSNGTGADGAKESDRDNAGRAPSPGHTRPSDGDAV